MKIPCEECIVYAACKQKLEFECSILFNFMEENIEYDDDNKVVKGSPSAQIWIDLNKQFQREYGEIRVTKSGCMVAYAIVSKKQKKEVVSEDALFWMSIDTHM